MKVQASGVEIEVQDTGGTGPAVLLVMGLGMQLIAWPDVLLQMLLQRGFRVIRHDNRDVGLSQGFDRLGTPNVLVQALRHRLRLRVRAPYQVADMAADALGVLDALGIERAHICGASMGGMIAQHIAAKHPRRVKSLTLIMTSTGSRRVGNPKPAVFSALTKRRVRLDRIVAIDINQPLAARLLGVAELRIETATTDSEVKLAYLSVSEAREIRAMGGRASMGLKPATPIEPYEDLLSELDMVLIMTVEPGFGGQKFLDLCLPKLRRTRALADRHGLDLASAPATRAACAAIAGAGVVQPVAGVCARVRRRVELVAPDLRPAR